VREAWLRHGPLTTFSAGITVHEADVEPRETMRRADAALYEAKEAGRNRDVYAPETLIDVTFP
jgi:PleD family two-component response regulator